MRWAARTLLAGTAGLAIVGAGAVTAAHAAGGTPPATPSVTTGSTHDQQLDALTAAEHDLRTQLAGLEEAMAHLSAAVPSPTVTAPQPHADETTPASPATGHEAPDDHAPAIQQPADHGEHESGSHDDSGTDD